MIVIIIIMSFVSQNDQITVSGMWFYGRSIKISTDDDYECNDDEFISKAFN